MQIHYAAWSGDLDPVRRQLKRGVSIELRDKQYGLTPLMFAAESPHADASMLKLLIAQGADVNAVGRLLQETPLSLAVQCQSIDKVKHLLAAGANARYHTPTGHTPLMSPTSPPVDLIKILLAAGVDPNAEAANGETALSIAAQEGNIDAMRVLLAGGANPDVIGWPKLHWTVALGTVEEVAAEIAAGADVNERTEAGWQLTPFLLSVFIGSLAKANLLLDSGANWEDKSRWSRTALMYATARDSVDVLEWLLSAEPEIEASDNFGFTALHMAAKSGAPRCVQALIKAGAEVDAVAQHDAQPINFAKTPEIARVLVEAGAEIDYVNALGYCLLRTAAEHEDDDFVEALLAMGAAADATRSGTTALHAAVKEDDLQAVEMLLQAGADPNALDELERPVLHMAQTLEAVETLLEAGADPNGADQLGQNAVQVYDDTEILAALIHAGAAVDPEDTSYGTALTRAAEDGDLERLKFLLEAGAGV